MSNEQVTALILKKLDELSVDQKDLRNEMRVGQLAMQEEMRNDHRQVVNDIASIRAMLAKLTERVSNLEIRFSVYQWILCTGSAAVGALLWKIPAIIEWVKSQI